jgi:hypothetical protein
LALATAVFHAQLLFGQAPQPRVANRPLVPPPNVAARNGGPASNTAAPGPAAAEVNPKHLRMLPNSKHSTSGTDIGESMTAWYDAVIRNRPIPDYAWTVREDGALVVRPGGQPSQVLLWQGTNPDARDFRVDVIGDKAFTSTPLAPAADGSYVASVPKPAKGFTAYFVELTYPSGTQYPFKFTTEVYVKPDILPYRWEDARPITAPDEK